MRSWSVAPHLIFHIGVGLHAAEFRDYACDSMFVVNESKTVSPFALWTLSKLCVRKFDEYVSKTCSAMTWRYTTLPRAAAAWKGFDQLSVCGATASPVITLSNARQAPVMSSVSMLGMPASARLCNGVQRPGDRKE